MVNLNSGLFKVLYNLSAFCPNWTNKGFAEIFTILVRVHWNSNSGPINVFYALAAFYLNCTNKQINFIV